MDKRVKNHGPIFIGGLGRSGKTLMRFMLSSHPNIVFSRRTNMWTQVYNRYGDLSQHHNFERCLHALLSRKHVAFLQPDPERIRREFWQGAPTYGRLFALVHEHYAEREGKVRWGDQTELIESCADLLFVTYPQAKLIHLIRDPRDRYEAVLARRSDGSVMAGEATAMWQYSAALAKHNQQVYPDRYKIVHYETMVSQPEETMREVCAFLQESYSPAMLTLADIPRYKGFYDRTKRSPISTEFIGRFRRELSPQEIAFIQAFTGRYRRVYGYETEPVALSWRDRAVLYSVTGPLNLARMLAWHPRRAAQSHGPMWLDPSTVSKRVLRGQVGKDSRTETI